MQQTKLLPWPRPPGNRRQQHPQLAYFLTFVCTVLKTPSAHSIQSSSRQHVVSHEGQGALQESSSHVQGGATQATLQGTQLQSVLGAILLETDHRTMSGSTLNMELKGQSWRAASGEPSNHAVDPNYGPEGPTVLGTPGDWFFSVATTECNGQVTLDNTPQTTLSRVLLPLLLGACVLAVLGMAMAGSDEGRDGAPAAEESGDTPQEGTAATAPSGGGRRYYADFARICAIGCVIFEHCGGTSYTYRNVGFGLWWALPYLYMTSGMMCVLSKSSMEGYLLRLLCVFLVGVSANLVGDMVSGRAWRSDFANTVFQMWFVVMLMGMAVLMDPVRSALLWARDRKQQDQCPAKVKVGIAAYGLLTFGSLILFMAAGALPDLSAAQDSPSDWVRFYAPMLQSMPLMLVQVAGPAFLVTWASVVLAPRFLGQVGWLLFALVYGSKVLMPFDMDGFPHLLGLYVISMVITVWPLAGSKQIASAVRSYWPFLFMSLCLLALPDMLGRCDVHPPGFLWERLRFNAGEFVMVLLFSTAALECDDPHQVTVWMGWWSLFAYCFHVCFFRIFGTPIAAVVAFGSILPFYMLHRQGLLGGSPKKKKPEIKAASLALPK